MWGDQAEHQGAVGARAVVAVVERGGGAARAEGEPAPRIWTVGGDRAVARLRTESLIEVKVRRRVEALDAAAFPLGRVGEGELR